MVSILKKVSIVITFLILSIVLLGCSNQQEEVNEKVQQNDVISKDVREVVWNQLTAEDKDRIEGTWENAKVSTIVLKEGMLALQLEGKTSPYVGTEVYLIDFPIKGKQIPNNMIAYADKNSLKYIGHGLVD